VSLYREDIMRSTCNSLRKAAIALHGLLALAVSSCGGDGGSSTAQPAHPLPVTAQILYSFGGTSTDAMGPSGVLIQGSDGNFYGTTFSGGLAECSHGAATGDPAVIGCGTVFKISPTGEETVLHLFGAAAADGANPEVLIQGSDGNFYGTTASGGANNAGTVFKLTLEGVETILYSFTGGSDGGRPAGGLVQGTDGNLYGTTANGGTNNAGTVFKLTPQGVETVLHSFEGVPDGADPVGQLVQGGDGNFYGVTSSGGRGVSGSNGFLGGTVFKITPEGTETILHRFSGPDGESPQAGLIQGSDGNFYGTTDSGTNSLGTVFKLTPEGVETTLYSFSGSDGAFPYASLIQGSDGNFYGTTGGGGTNEGGTMFQLTPAGIVTVLYSFPNTSGEYAGTQLPGAEPNTNLMQGSDGNLFGTTFEDGAYDRGYFFRLALK
jgi:uncharacterized repeat protein (TIGR03803 family)